MILYFIFSYFDIFVLFISIYFLPPDNGFTKTPRMANTIWDTRAIRAPLHSLRSHEEEAVVVRWAPLRTGLLGSCSMDGRIILWDLEREVEVLDEVDSKGSAVPADPQVWVYS